MSRPAAPHPGEKASSGTPAEPVVAEDGELSDRGASPWRGELSFCFVAESQEEAGNYIEVAIDALEGLGIFVQLGSAEAMSADDVVPASPLAEMLEAHSWDGLYRAAPQTLTFDPMLGKGRLRGVHTPTSATETVPRPSTPE